MLSAGSVYYLEVLYPWQDRVLQLLSALETGFYLTGGTAASRGYLNHRFSDDLDFFVNDAPQFSLWTERVIAALAASEDWSLRVLVREERFARLSLGQSDNRLNIELINDVPAHVGEIVQHPLLGRLDSADNILANKITALIGREEPKDLADIWGFCCRNGMSLSAAIENADSKAAGIFPADIARLLCSASDADWQVIKWTDPPDRQQFVNELYRLGESLLIQP